MINFLLFYELKILSIILCMSMYNNKFNYYPISPSEKLKCEKKILKLWYLNKQLWRK